MFPERLPGSVDSEAERRLFDQFRTEFSDDFTVFAGVSWISKRRGKGAFDGEADFVVAHPRHGVLVLEVKGGGIEYDARAGRWYSQNRAGQRNNIKDPFRQARTSKHVLKKKLAEAEPTARYEYQMSHAVVFPDAYLEDISIVQAGDEIVLDLPKVRALKQSIIDAYSFFRNTPAEPGKAAIEALIEVLASSWRVEMLLRSALEAREKVVRELTEQQYRLLDFIAKRPRALISGGAGTGKTMLAIEKARRLARAEFNVLFICYNANLAHWAQEQLAGSGVQAATFHGVCHEFISRAGMDVPLQDDGSPDYDRFADCLLEALPLIDDRFDAVIVDEGQDFKEEWWVAVQSILDEPNDGPLYIFYDDNQRIYERAGVFPMTDPPLTLTENCRNTKQIHQLVVMFYQGDGQFFCSGPDGDRLALIMPANGQTELDAVLEHIDSLLSQQVAPGDIAVLTPKTKEKSAWKDCPRVQWDLRQAGGKIACSSIYRFKGLERPVVIVVELSRMNPAEQAELLYVAFSRARQYLAVEGLDLQAVAELQSAKV
jgi:hypothetical protein